MVGCRCVAAGLVSIFPTSRLFCDLHFYYDDDERDNSLFHPLDEVNVEHLQTTTTRKEKWRVVCCILGAKKSEYLLFQLCLEGNTNTHNWFFSFFLFLDDCVVVVVVFLGENGSRIWNYMERKRTWTLAYIPPHYVILSFFLSTV